MQKRFTPDEGGAFPEWEEKTLGECMTLIASKGYKGKDLVNDEDKTIMFSPSDIDAFGAVSLVKNAHISDDLFKKSKEALVKNGDILFTKTASIGKVGYVKNLDHNATINPQIVILRANEDVDSYFLFCAVRTEAFKKQVRKISGGTTIKTMSQKALKELKIKIPKSIEEQRKIAAALAAYDEMIAVKTAKLETWQECKKRMVKEIFGRTKRFKNDDGNEFPEWEEKTLGEVCKYGNTHKTGKNYIKVENMNKDFSGVTFLEPSLEKKGVVYGVGDVLMSNIRPYLRKAWLADKDGVCDSDVLVFHLKDDADVDSTFLYYTIASSEFVKWAMIGARGTKMPRCDKQHLMEKRIFLPCKEEQQKIGSFLTEIDKEIEIQKEFIKTYAEGKKRMMRELMEENATDKEVYV